MLLAAIATVVGVIGVGPLHAAAGGTPSVTTSAPSSASIALGSYVTDTATVTGQAGAAPTGTVTFSFCVPPAASCQAPSGQVFDTETLVNPGASLTTATATSIAFSPDTTGQWCFRADYGGDGTYATSTDNSAGECFTVTKANSTTTTQPSSNSIVLGNSITATATMTGVYRGVPPAGSNSVTFYTCLTTCAGAHTGTALGSAVTPTPVAGHFSYTSTATSSTSFTPQNTGTPCVQASYAGDGNYNASDDTSGSCYTVTKATPTTTSQPSAATISLGSSVTDTATVTGNASVSGPTGSVTFYECGPNVNSCSSAGTMVSNNAFSGGTSNAPTATSSSFMPLMTGTFCFAAVYSGDGNYATTSDGSSGECFTVGGATVSTTASQPSATTITTAGTLTDTATVTGSNNITPTGTVTFYVCGPAATSCSSTTTQVGAAKSVSGSGSTASATSDAFPNPTPGTAGTWCFYAVYSGDNVYAGSNDHSANECFRITGTTQDTVVSQPSAGNITKGQTVTDLATITGPMNGPTPGGTVSFYICGPAASSCSSTSTPVGTAVTVGGSGHTATATSSSFSTNTPGTWCFYAVYSGDNNYVMGADSSASECVKVTGTTASTAMSHPSAATVTTGQTVTDTLTVTGPLNGATPSGVVAFYICGPFSTPTGCASTTTQVGAVKTISGSGNSAAATSDPFPPSLPNAPGTWCFLAIYSGDNTYKSNSDGSSTECFKVTGTTPDTTVSHPSAASITTAQSVTDMASVTGSGNVTPTGTVTFYVCGPGASSCTLQASPAQVGAAKTLGGSGNTATATSSSFSTASTGRWCFLAVYSGDNNYLSNSDGSATECFNVTGTAASSTVSSPRAQSITPGGLASDKATVASNPAGGITPTGTVTFFECGPLSGANGCPIGTGTAVGAPITLNAGGAATSSTFSPSAQGTWCFRAEYSGDATYAASADASSGECFTDAQPAFGPVNGSFQDDNFTGWTTTGFTSIGGGGDTSDDFLAGIGNTGTGHGGPSGASSISQTFTVSASATGLTFLWFGFCPAGDTVGTKDWATATLKDVTAGTSAVTILPKTCQASSGFQTANASVIGSHKYTLTLSNHDDGDSKDGNFTAFDAVADTPPGTAPTSGLVPPSFPRGHRPSMRTF